MESTLTCLIATLRSTLQSLNGDQQGELLAQLHDHNKLPSRSLAKLASEAVDLLHETEQLLEPGPLILADHFMGGYINSKCLNTALEFNIPDLLREGPKSLVDIACLSSARPDRLRQVLRVLCNNGIFTYNAPADTYANNTTSELLLSDHWTQWCNWVDLYGNEFYNMARGIPASCAKDATRTAAQINFDTDLDMFTYFTNQGWLPRLHKTLSGGAVAQAPGILEDYPWEAIADSTFLDIGGGGGGLVALILRKHKSMQAGIFDLPRAIEQARSNFRLPHGEFSDVQSQVLDENLIVGDFFSHIPSFEVYTMKWCLHDWLDNEAMTILRNIRSSIKYGAKSRLIVFESLLSDGHMGRLSRYGDITMMVSANGGERSEDQWRALASATGWKINHIYHLRNSWPCAIEFVPLWTADSMTLRAGHSKDNMGSTETDPASIAERSEVTCLNITKDDSTPRKHECKLSYLEPWNPSRGEPFFRSEPDEGFESTNLNWVERTVTVTDARPNKSVFDLDHHGFAFYEDTEGFTAEIQEALQSNDKGFAQQFFYPQVEALVKRKLGASRVIIFDHTVRKKRLGEDEDISMILKSRVKLLNVWRPLHSTVQSWPLALLDYQSLQAANVHPCNLWRHKFEDRGQTMAFSHADGQQWYYLDSHRTDEVTMIKIWDNDDHVAAKCENSACYIDAKE
ncbi:hypothetical protein G7Y79_00067g095620 [Physcia stellaris]|nr:hypothetical protein G7Y79_00067g095620 [Physcia stellaris]